MQGVPFKFPFDFPFDQSSFQNFWFVLQQVLTVILVVVIVLAVIAIVLWVLQSVGYMRMGRKTAFPDPWLSWIPGVSTYLFIRLAGKEKRKLGIAYLFLMAFGFLAVGIIMCAFMIPNMAMMYTPQFNLAAFPGMIIGMVLFMGLAVALTVIRLILLYHIFRRFKPDSAVAFVVLSIFFSFLEPIFVFAASFGEPDALAPSQAPPQAG